jgi:release factor glutamine methyltransferase
MIYKPSEDSILLAQCIRTYRGKNALEIGVGSGIILETLESRFERVFGTDIDYDALLFCKGKTRALLVCCDAASPFVQSGRFDLIVSNPPYLPSDEKIFDRAVHGGPTGIEATVRFMASALPLLAEPGKILVILSSLADSAALDDFIARENLRKRVVKEKKLFYETLSALEIER